MRHFFASYPWQQVCFSSENPSSCADAVSDVIRQAMEYFIPYSDVPVGGSTNPWFSADCVQAEQRKHSAFLAWVNARDRKAPDLISKKRAFNHAAKSYKKALKRLVSTALPTLAQSFLHNRPVAEHSGPLPSRSRRTSIGPNCLRW